MLDRVIDGRGFITAMRHAVGAFWVVARAVTIPIGFFDQSFERRRVTFVHEQIAGPSQPNTLRVGLPQGVQR